MLKLYSFQGYKVGSTYAKSMWYTSVLKEKTKKPHDYLNRYEKPFDTIQHPFMIKNSHQSGYGGKYLNI